MTTSDEFYTPPEEVEFVREFLGEIDLDPASCEDANKIVRAKQYYTKADDGLSLPWDGKVFCNPPYSRGLIEEFVKGFLLMHGGKANEGILLVNANTSSSWFQRALKLADAVCFCGATDSFNSRIKFIGGDSGARAASVYFYCGRRPWEFCEHFEKRGYVINLRG